MIKSSSCELRPHHALCIRFFEGKGYSQAFIRNMTDCIVRLEQMNPLVHLTADCDLLCRCCPHQQNGRCSSHEKVHRIDCACLRYCGLSFGDTLSWRELQALTHRHILLPDRLPVVCGDCQWSDICRSALSRHPIK